MLVSGRVVFLGSKERIFGFGQGIIVIAFVSAMVGPLLCWLQIMTHFVTCIALSWPYDVNLKNLWITGKMVVGLIFFLGAIPRGPHHFPTVDGRNPAPPGMYKTL